MLCFFVFLGIPIAVYPEGQISGRVGLNDFKNGLFQLAAETNAHILPVVLSGTEVAW